MEMAVGFHHMEYFDESLYTHEYWQAPRSKFFSVVIENDHNSSIIRIILIIFRGKL